MRRGRCKEETPVAGEKPPACRLASAIGYPSHAGAVEPHYVLLITRLAVTSALQRQPLTVVTEVSLRILSAECDLLHRGEVCFSRYRCNHARCDSSSCCFGNGAISSSARASPD